jgi:hypothetical protein
LNVTCPYQNGLIQAVNVTGYLVNCSVIACPRRPAVTRESFFWAIIPRKRHATRTLDHVERLFLSADLLREEWTRSN